MYMYINTVLRKNTPSFLHYLHYLQTCNKNVTIRLHPRQQ